MPAYSMDSIMDCDEGCESSNQKLLERNKYLEGEVHQMQSDFHVLKEKIICTDTLIKKLQEKHKLCVLLELKCKELRKILDSSKGDCDGHIKEYQELLLKFGPLQKEKEILEKKCQQQGDEMEQLKNNIKSHEVFKNQITEAGKEQNEELKGCRKENRLLQAKLKHLKRIKESAEKREMAIRNRAMIQKRKRMSEKVPRKFALRKNKEKVKPILLHQEVPPCIKGLLCPKEFTSEQGLTKRNPLTENKMKRHMSNEDYVGNPEVSKNPLFGNICDVDEDYNEGLASLYEGLQMSSDEEPQNARESFIDLMSPYTDKNLFPIGNTGFSKDFCFTTQSRVEGRRDKELTDYSCSTYKTSLRAMEAVDPLSLHPCYHDVENNELSYVSNRCLSPEGENATDECRVNSTCDPSIAFNSSPSEMTSSDALIKTKKPGKCQYRSRRKLSVEFLKESEDIEVVIHHSKVKRKKCIDLNVTRMPANEIISFEKFEMMNSEEILSLVDLGRPLSPLPNRSKFFDKDKELLSNTKLIGNCEGTLIVKQDASIFLKDFYINLLNFIYSDHQPLSPLLLELRNQRVSGTFFTRIIIKTLRKCNFNVMNIWFGSKLSANDAYSIPLLPPPVVRLVEIIISCGSHLDEGKEILEVFLKSSTLIILHHKGNGAFSKFKESFISSLCCCVVAVLRLQGNMERARMLLYEVIKNSPRMRECTVIMTICAVWPQCFLRDLDEGKHFSAILKVLQYYILVSVNEQKAESFVNQYIAWDLNNFDASDLAFWLFRQTEMSLRRDITEGEAKTVIWEMQCAILLMCYKEGWDWTRSEIISNLIWPYLGSWANNSRNFNAYFIQLVVDLLGLCLLQYLDRVDKENYDNIFEDLKLLVLETSVLPGIRECALRSVLRLSSPSSVPQDVLPFIDSHRNSFEDVTSALLQSFNI